MSGSILTGPTDISQAPVDARLFGGYGGRGPGTAPSAARMAELERIARLYGYLPPIDQGFIAALGGAPTPTAPMPVQMPEGRMPPAAMAAPPRSMADMGLTMPQRPSPEAQLADMAVQADMARAQTQIEQSAQPAGAVPPAQRANAAPQNPGEANFWERLLGPRSAEAAGGVTTNVGRRTQREAEDALLEQQVMDAAGRRPTMAEPTAPPAPTQEAPAASPPAQGPNDPSAPGGTTPSGAGRYGRFEGRDPDFSRVMEAYERGRPMTRERDPEERTLRLVAAALGGMQGRTGVDVASGAVAGLGAGYARESDRDEAIWQQDETARRQFELGLAGLLGQQEQAQFNNALARQGFDRTSMLAEDADARARESLGIQREAAGQARMLNQLRIASLVQRLGMGADEGQIFGRGLNALIDAPGAQLMVDGRPFMLDVDGQQMTVGQLRAAINARRTDVQTRFMTNPAAYNAQINAEISDRIMRAIMSPNVSEGQRRQLMQQLARLAESRPRSGGAQVSDE